MWKCCAFPAFCFLLASSSLSVAQEDAKSQAPKELEPLLAKYKYPKSNSGITRGWGINEGVLILYQGVFLTPDNPQQVRDWYTKNLLKLKDSVGEDKVMVLEDGLAIIQHDWTAQDDKDDPFRDRPGSVTAIFQTGKETTWSVVISRMEGEKLTHIAVSIKRTKKG